MVLARSLEIGRKRIGKLSSEAINGRELYEYPIGIDQKSLLRVDVDQLTTDAKAMNRVLTWCNLRIDPRRRLGTFMQEIGQDR